MVEYLWMTNVSSRQIQLTQKLDINNNMLYLRGFEKLNSLIFMNPVNLLVRFHHYEI